jgi:hypothetical protein
VFGQIFAIFGLAFPELPAGVESVGEIILGKKNPGKNYLIHIESNESRKKMVPVPEKTQNSKTIYIATKIHTSIKTLRNDYNRLRATSLFISTAYLVTDESLQLGLTRKGVFDTTFEQEPNKKSLE